MMPVSASTSTDLLSGQSYRPMAGNAIETERLLGRRARRAAGNAIIGLSRSKTDTEIDGPWPKNRRPTARQQE
jgi:hypothetical protein